jgi:hypothetical protein
MKITNDTKMNRAEAMCSVAWATFGIVRSQQTLSAANFPLARRSPY